MEPIKDNVRDILKASGYKYTNQRALIYNVFVENQEDHLSTEEVYAIVQEKDPEVGIATVYRTLQLFDELGLLYKISFDDGVSRYELKSSIAGHRHHHLMCLGCGVITEFKHDLLDTLENEIEVTENFKVVDHNLKFYGYCKNCQTEKKGANNEKQ